VAFPAARSAGKAHFSGVVWLPGIVMMQRRLIGAG
jgi:hypothetical protein